MREGIELGILCPYHYFGCFDDIDYSNIRHNGVRYDIRDLERALIIPERDAAIISKWREKAEGKPTLAFCCSHRHAERVAASFQRADVPAVPYLSTTASALRSRIRGEFRSGAIKVLCVVNVLNEGIDLPFAECLLFLRPTESKRIFFQQLGRGLRHFVGKERCIVIDFIGNFQNAYRIVEYQGLDSSDDERSTPGTTFTRTAKDTLNLPAGCLVEFDERVIDVFGHQTLNPAYATRHNIGRILLYQYQKLERRLGRRPTKADVDRQCLLGSTFYCRCLEPGRTLSARLQRNNIEQDSWTVRVWYLRTGGKACRTFFGEAVAGASWARSGPSLQTGGGAPAGDRLNVSSWLEPRR